jgi:Legionella pneumophila major outer membrane protein precursor
MVRLSVLLFGFAALGVTTSRGLAQAPANAENVPELLRSAPELPAAPASLFQAAPPPPAPPLPDRPYFQFNPDVDQPEFPQPGCLFSIGLGIVTPHVKDQLSGAVQNPASGNSDIVSMARAPLGWTVSPSLEAGYRLPSGFGAISLGYRFLEGLGTTTNAGPDGPAALRSRLDVNQFDLRYTSSELSLWPHWEMRWGVGARLASVFFDSQATESFDDAAAGSGVFLTRASNHFVGIGPSATLELQRHVQGTGFSFVGWLELSHMLGRINQKFVEDLTAPDANGNPQAAQATPSSSQAVPMLNAQAGLAWQPSSLPAASFFLGYQYEHWWNVGRLSAINDMGELVDQGVMLRASWNY